MMGKVFIAPTSLFRPKNWSKLIYKFVVWLNPGVCSVVRDINVKFTFFTGNLAINFTFMSLR